MDKWEELKLLIDGQMAWPVIYSHSREFEKGEMKRVKEWMKYLEEKEKQERRKNIDKALETINERHGETLKALDDKQKGFLYTDIPTFDQKTWERILEEKGLQGLS